MSRLSIWFLLLTVIRSSLAPVALADDAEQPLVFVSAFAKGDEGAIHAYRLDLDSGQLKPVHRTTDVQSPFFMALSADNRFLYSIHAADGPGEKRREEVTAFELLGNSGKMKLLNRQSARGTTACYLDIDPSGKALVLANYSSGTVVSYPVQENGSLGSSTSFFQHQGSSIDPGRQKGPHAHSIVISPDGRFALAADLGLDQILSYRLDAMQAKLTPNRQPFVRTTPGAGPRHLRFHPNGKHVYVINELNGSITQFDYETQSGLLIERQTIATLPEEFEGKSWCADLKITPDGRFLYGTNRGHDSIAAYRIDDAGRLSLVEMEPSRGKNPQNLAISADGKFLLCANMGGGNVAVFRIDSQSGTLTQVGSPVAIPNPSCIMIR